ncbi:hypothetical protein M0208_13740 [Sphingomonas sp. SUN019]|uniref:hypothetical protein n=1 Tax=Sphingomonas sp. SUN019 TaxID=2937788 RepID=UPI002164EDAC|nr:hypothetical protein [Sphingomonas sp. SUN019]UVO51511.1 hypothetical protein M0208_13740 [Sphingomonas sp. SUN019]
MKALLAEQFRGCFQKLDPAGIRATWGAFYAALQKIHSYSGFRHLRLSDDGSRWRYL